MAQWRPREIAASASRTDTFHRERYRRLVRRRGRRNALAAIARSILAIIFHLLTDPAVRFRNLGPDYYDAPTRGLKACPLRCCISGQIDFLRCRS